MGLVVELAGYLRLIDGVSSYMGFGDSVIVDCFYILYSTVLSVVDCIYILYSTVLSVVDCVYILYSTVLHS